MVNVEDGVKCRKGRVCLGMLAGKVPIDNGETLKGLRKQYSASSKENIHLMLRLQIWRMGSTVRKELVQNCYSGKLLVSQGSGHEGENIIILQKDN